MLLLVGRLLPSAILVEPRSVVVKSVAEQALTLFFSFTNAVYPARVHSVIAIIGTGRL
jgi:hypothetical protein